MTLFVDASAIIAIVLGESGAAALSKQLDVAEKAITSPLARWEAVVALFRGREFGWENAQGAVDDLLTAYGVSIVPIEALQGQYALNVFAGYGKGRHPAKLNMGDCFAYACAKTNDARLLYKGDDFAKTDLA